MSESPFGRIKAQLAEEGQGVDDALEPLCAELWDLCQSGVQLFELTSARSVGLHFLDAGSPPSQAAAEVLALGRPLVREATSSGVDAARARKCVDDAAVQVAHAVEVAGRARRQSWLSYLVHEVKNPLNTVLNALWLLREKGSDPLQAARFIELAERAVKRLEARARDVRQLDEDLLHAPPGWQAPAPGDSRAPGHH